MTTLTKAKNKVKIHLEESKKSLFYFVNLFYKKSLKFDGFNFQGGQFVKDVCHRLENNNFVIEVTGRNHCKSSRLYWEIMRNILFCETSIEEFYMSYTQPMAQYHLRQIKDLINKNYLFRELLIDLKPSADSVLNYKSKVTGGEYLCTPHGILTFNRGKHTNHTIYCDDLLSDPANRLDPTSIIKVNRIVREQILSIVNPDGGRIRMVGTPQTQEDFFFDENLADKFLVTIQPAIVDGKPIWPERWSLAALEQKRKEIGQSVFNQEYMVSPVYFEDAFLNGDMVEAAIKPRTDLKNFDQVVAGYDPAKQRHAAHISILGKKDEIYYQLESKFFDKTDYSIQLEWLKTKIKEYGISKVNYDATRGEFSILEERGELPLQMKPISFNVKTKTGHASNLDSLLTAKSIFLLPDQRQKKHLMSVTNDLQAVETKDGEGKIGHADAFWSNALAVGMKSAAPLFTPLDF